MAELVHAAKQLAHAAVERGVDFPKVHNRTEINEFCGSALMDTNTPEGFDMEAAMENLIKKYGTHEHPGRGTKSQQGKERDEQRKREH